MRSYRPVSIALAFMLAAAPLAACAPTDAVDAKQEQEDAIAPEPSLISGTWTIDTSQNERDALSDQDRARFERAAQSYEGLILTPRLVLATARGDGMDRAYLCTSKGDETDTDSWAIATVHESDNGDAKILKVCKIDLTKIASFKHPQQNLALGRWELADMGSKSILSDSKVTIAPPANSKEGVSYTPLALFGTSDKPSSKRLYLAWETSDGERTPAKALALTTVELDDAGKANTIAAEELDLLAYL